MAPRLLWAMSSSVVAEESVQLLQAMLSIDAEGQVTAESFDSQCWEPVNDAPGGWTAQDQAKVQANGAWWNIRAICHGKGDEFLATFGQNDNFPGSVTQKVPDAWCIHRKLGCVDSPAQCWEGYDWDQQEENQVSAGARPDTVCHAKGPDYVMTWGRKKYFPDTGGSWCVHRKPCPTPAPTAAPTPAPTPAPTTTTTTTSCIIVPEPCPIAAKEKTNVCPEGCKHISSCEQCEIAAKFWGKDYLGEQFPEGATRPTGCFKNRNDKIKCNQKGNYGKARRMTPVCQKIVEPHCQ